MFFFLCLAAQVCGPLVVIIPNEPCMAWITQPLLIKSWTVWEFDGQNVRTWKFLSHFLHSVHSNVIQARPGEEFRHWSKKWKRNAYLLPNTMSALGFHSEITVVLFKSQSSWVSWEIGSIAFHTIIWRDINKMWLFEGIFQCYLHLY